MNTSDQSLFPIDSAFKRRWEWKYLPIKDAQKNHVIRVDGYRAYDWWEFLMAINTRIEKLTELEDKQLGYWFAKPNNGLEISVERFVSKVVFYLWNDVFKDYGNDGNSPFNIKQGEDKRLKLKFTSFFDPEGNALPDVVATFIEALGVKPITSETEPTTPSSPEEQEEPNETHDDAPSSVVEEAPAEYQTEYPSSAADDVDDDDEDGDDNDKELFDQLYR